jgi:hypothetical protein
MADSCKHSNEPLGSIKVGKFIYQLSNYQQFSKNSGQRSSFKKPKCEHCGIKDL